ncbi:hypothetical protein ACFQV8_40600 [Pseudonocardia benzenivorans]
MLQVVEPGDLLDRPTQGGMRGDVVDALAPQPHLSGVFLQVLDVLRTGTDGHRRSLLQQLEC